MANKFDFIINIGVDNNSAIQNMKRELDEAMKPFALDTAFYAIIEQEKIRQDYKKGKL